MPLSRNSTTIVTYDNKLMLEKLNIFQHCQELLSAKRHKHIDIKNHHLVDHQSGRSLDLQFILWLINSADLFLKPLLQQRHSKLIHKFYFTPHTSAVPHTVVSFGAVSGSSQQCPYIHDIIQSVVHHTH